MKRFLTLLALLFFNVLVPQVQGQVLHDSEEHPPSLSAFSPQEIAVEHLLTINPDVRILQEGPAIKRVYGTTLGVGANPIDTAAQFAATHAELFGAEARDILPTDRTFAAPQTMPLMLDRQTNEQKLTLIQYPQVRDGIPVFRSNLRLLVRNVADSPLVLAASSLNNLGNFSVDPILANLEFDPATQTQTGMTQFSKPEKVIWAGIGNQATDPVLAVTFTGRNDRTDAGYEAWRFVCDAATGEILYRETLIHFADVKGSVKAMATPGPKSASCTDEILFPYPWAKVSIQGGSTVYADRDGNFTIPNSGTSSVTVRSNVDGKFFTIDNQAGAEETLTATISPPGPANFVHNQADTSDLVLAQVNAYISANACRDWILSYCPSFPGISGSNPTPISIVVNRSESFFCPCQAWSDGSSLNFCQAGHSDMIGATCPNTAWQSIVDHEFAHHCLILAGKGQGAYGEGMGDCFSILAMDNPNLGYGFMGDCNSGIRSADNDCQYAEGWECSSCGSESHACGQLLSGIVWSIHDQLVVTEPKEYLNILSNIVINSILLHASETIDQQIAIDFLALDDDDGNIGNGTPHRNEICAGFGAHGILCPGLESALEVTPADSFVARAKNGEAFSPSSISYTIRNRSSTAIAYNITTTASWLTIPNAAGTLTKGQTATITISLNANADSLSDGVYLKTIRFINTTNHLGDTIRQAVLRVGDNDLCADAKTACPGVTYSGNTTGATNDGSDNCSSNGTPDVWYKYTPATNGTATFSLCEANTTFDTVLSLHGNCPGTSANLLECDNDGCGMDRISTITTTVKAATPYFIRISGESGAVGNYALTITGPDCNVLVPHLVVTPSDGFNSTGNVGGPFAPNSKTYTLQNTGGADLNYTISNTQNWGTLNNTGGTLGAGQSTTVTVSINSAANTLPNGSYADTISFVNTANQENTATRSVSLACTDTASPTPNPMTFAVAPTPNGTTSISMTASTAQDVQSPPVSYYFNFVSGGTGGNDSGWQTSADYVNTGLTANTAYTYRVKARDSAATPHETEYSEEATTTTLIETPTGISIGMTTANSIELRAVGKLSNLAVGMSGAYFDSVTPNGRSGINAWIHLAFDTAVNLSPDTSYTFRVKARNQNGVETAFSPTADARTLAATPTPPTLSNPTTTSMSLDLSPNGNPATTVFAIRCIASVPPDASWTNQFVDAAGNPTDTAVWQTDAAWGVIFITGLTPNHAYVFAAQARNGNNIETALGTGANLKTLPWPTGACCNSTTGTCTTVTQADCSSAGGSYEGDDKACDPNPCLQPTGACCFAIDGRCEIMTEANCRTAGGAFQGNKTTCDPNPCQPTTEEPEQPLPDTCGSGALCGTGGAGLIPLMLIGLARIKTSRFHRKVSPANRRNEHR